jgi:hypothetical protein
VVEKEQLATQMAKSQVSSKQDPSLFPYPFIDPNMRQMAIADY